MEEARRVSHLKTRLALPDNFYRTALLKWRDYKGSHVRACTYMPCSTHEVRKFTRAVMLPLSITRGPPQEKSGREAVFAGVGRVHCEPNTPGAYITQIRQDTKTTEIAAGEAKDAWIVKARSAFQPS